MTIDIHHGDSRDVLRGLADASIDSCVCDPPYALVSIVKRFGADKSNLEVSEGKDLGTIKAAQYKRLSGGFMGQKWDTGETAFDPAFWAEVLRVLKPGGHLLAFGGTRTYHRLACAIEDSGFEVRDMTAWLYGSGFPKSHNVAKAIDRAAGAEPIVVSENETGWQGTLGGKGALSGIGDAPDVRRTTRAATPEAAQWEGWGTALKPALEPICLARKPLVGTVAANVLTYGTGALNIDACRIAGPKPDTTRGQPGRNLNGLGAQGRIEDDGCGRWPANVVLDGSAEVVEAFPRGEESAARFFYSAKADADDRLQSKHPTVKPVDLMAYLIRLVTPPGGTVLDPFAGSGSTGMAAMREGFNAVLIEREAAYVADIRRRVAHVSGADTPLFSSTTQAGE